jgi:hypothetical protein
MTIRLLYRFALAFSLVLAALAGATSTARANTLCVNHGGTGGCKGTIADAISAAGPGDTITIAGGSPYVEHLIIAKSLSLVGDSAATTIIDGNSVGQVLRITGTITVSLSNLSIQHGHPLAGDTSDQWGGGIHNERATLTLNHVVVTLNQAGGDNTIFAGNGGGIYTHDATLTLNHSTVSFNSTGTPEARVGDGGDAGNGGGIFNDAGTVILNDSLVHGNLTGTGGDGSASGGYGGYGAGVDNFHGQLTLNRTAVTGNITGDGGSGSVGGPGGGGAGIFDDMGTTTIVASTISGNQTGSGGSGGSGLGRSGIGAGMYIDGTGSFVPHVADISNSTLSANATGQGLSSSKFGDGGGIYTELANPVMITNTTIAYNSVDPGMGGGGITASFLAVVYLKNSLLAQNRTSASVPVLTDCTGPLTSLGYNGILNPLLAFCSVTATTGDLFSNAGLTVAPLAYNGGPTQTNALPSGSLAVDAADNSVCSATDQRGFKRPVFGGVALRCDIGAFELYRFRLSLPVVRR